MFLRIGSYGSSTFIVEMTKTKKNNKEKKDTIYILGEEESRNQS